MKAPERVPSRAPTPKPLPLGYGEARLTIGPGRIREASLFAKKVARGYAKIVDALEKALMKQNGNQLPKELEAKFAQISKMAAARRDKHPTCSRICRAIGLAKRRG